MTRLHVHSVSNGDTATALAMLDAELVAGAIVPRMLFAFYGCEHDDWMLHQYLSARFPLAARMGG